ncbi:nitroreductase [Nocardioides campestrisoli]|uniref:nitroreductase n=1 Tax=Nocardioides campestrisoli TaxID=2736757 RepID=UPI001CD318C8|nr:nitroreductase [Nocardioides campestrisoli]
MTPETELEQLLAARYSCRAFRPDPVPDQLVDRLFATAQRTPSWCNTQPWQVHLLGGEATARFAKELGEHVVAHEQVADLGLPAYEGIHADRRREAGYGLYSALGIAREDRAARSDQMARNFSFFGAPHCAVVTTGRDLGTYGAVDCGGYVNTLMLGAQALGLGVIAQGAVAMYSDFVRGWLDLPEDRLVVCAVSFGYADENDPVNAFRTTRADLGDVLHRLDG